MRSFTAFSSPARLAPTTRSFIAASVGVAVLAAVIGWGAPRVGAAPLADKQAQAAALDQQVSGLEQKYAVLQERYRGAQIDLGHVQTRMKRTQGRLARSRSELRHAKQRLETRALAVYRDGAGSTQLLEVARAGSFSDFFDKIDTIERVGTNDARLLNDVRTLTEKVAKQERQIRATRDRKVKLVRKINSSRKRMGSLLNDRRAALGSVTAEVRSLMQQQRAAEAMRLTKDSRARAAAIDAGEDPSKVVPTATGGAAAATPGGAANTDSSSSSSSSSSSESQISVPLPPPSGGASAAAGIAMGKIGAPYVFGASGPDSFDCSGLIVWAFAQAGRGGLPHSTYSLMGMGVSVPLSQAQSGDIVITDGGGHAGIYVGGGSMVHAPRTGRTVAVESLSYYSVVDVRRI
jgi:cell wall-associated NlpC family hydrolase